MRQVLAGSVRRTIRCHTVRHEGPHGEESRRGRQSGLSGFSPSRARCRRRACVTKEIAAARCTGPRGLEEMAVAVVEPRAAVFDKTSPKPSLDMESGAARRRSAISPALQICARDRGAFRKAQRDFLVVAAQHVCWIEDRRRSRLRGRQPSPRNNRSIRRERSSSWVLRRVQEIRLDPPGAYRY